MFGTKRNKQLDFLSQSIKLEESANPHIIQTTMFIICSAILAFVVWSSHTMINEIAKANGEILPEGYAQTVQHLDGGLVTDIFVTEGQTVAQGDLLLKVDDGGAQHDLAEVKTRQYFLSIEAERLRALIYGTVPDFEQFTKVDNGLERNYFADLAELDQRAQKLERSLEIAKEALGVQETLFKKGYASKLTLLRYKKEVSEIENQALKELSDIDIEFARNKEIIKKLERKVERLEVKSPTRGIVKGIAVNTIGAVIAPRQKIMEIIPIDEKLLAEVQISPKDIGHINIGQKVRIKVSSYDFIRYGTLDGEIASLSASTFLDANKTPYYLGKILISKNYVGNDPKKQQILPGMTLEADIITGKKTVLSYLLKPIHLYTQSALTDR